MAQNTFHPFKWWFFFFLFIYFEINQLNMLNICFRLFYINYSTVVSLCVCALFSPLTNAKRNKQPKKEEDEEKNKTKQNNNIFFSFVLWLWSIWTSYCTHCLSFITLHGINKSHRNYIHDIKVSFKLYKRNEIHQHWNQKTIIFSCDIYTHAHAYCYYCCVNNIKKKKKNQRARYTMKYR